jgi:hypothetical protein
MYKDFVDSQTALKLKELGFDEPCFGRYLTELAWQLDLTPKSFKLIECQNSKCNEYDLAAPTYHQVYNWFERYFTYYVEWMIDGWGDDQHVSTFNIGYTVFIWEGGKPRPHHTSEIGTGTREQMNPIVVNELITRANEGPDWDSLKDFVMDDPI